MRRRTMNAIGLAVGCLGLLSACQRFPFSHNDDECAQSVSAEIYHRMNDLAVKSEARRIAALDKWRGESGVSPLRLESVLTATDPYPSSVAQHLSPPSSSQILVLEKYLMFHGWVGAQTFYETAASSKKYFIVDEILLGTENQSAHSWHATAGNRLIRAVLRPKILSVDRVRICGCGPHAREVDENALLSGQPEGIQAEPVVSHGVFLLPGSELPQLLDPRSEVEWEQEQIDIEYVPATGKVCRADQVVC